MCLKLAAAAASALSVATEAKAEAAAAIARNEAAKAALAQALHKKPRTNAGGDPTAEDEQSSTTLRLHVSLLDREPHREQEGCKLRLSVIASCPKCN